MKKQKCHLVNAVQENTYCLEKPVQFVFATKDIDKKRDIKFTIDYHEIWLDIVAVIKEIIEVLVVFIPIMEPQENAKEYIKTSSKGGLFKIRVQVQQITADEAVKQDKMK